MNNKLKKAFGSLAVIFTLLSGSKSTAATNNNPQSQIIQNKIMEFYKIIENAVEEVIGFYYSLVILNLKEENMERSLLEKSAKKYYESSDNTIVSLYKVINLIKISEDEKKDFLRLCNSHIKSIIDVKDANIGKILKKKWNDSS